MQLTSRLRIYDLSSEKHLVCNALTGEVSVVRRPMYEQMEALREGCTNEFSPEALRTLDQKKLVFPSRADEDEAFRSLVESSLSRYLGEARTEYCIAVNTHCNFNCVYCFEPEGVRASVSTIGQEQLDAAFGFVDDAVAANPDSAPPEFTLYGGEPLLLRSKPAVISILEHVAARGRRAHIITNGYTLGDFFDVFDAHHGVIDSVQVTLDGVQLHHDQRRVLRGGAGTFSRIVANIDAFLNRNYGTRLSLRTSFDQGNVGGVEGLKQLLDEHGWSENPRVTVYPVTIQDHRACGCLEALVDYSDLLDAVFPYSTDVGGGPFDLSSIQVLGHVRSFLGAAARGKEATAFSARVTYCGGTALRLFVFHPDGRLYPCYEAVGRPDLAVGTYYPETRMDPEPERAMVRCSSFAAARVLRLHHLDLLRRRMCERGAGRKGRARCRLLRGCPGGVRPLLRAARAGIPRADERGSGDRRRLTWICWSWIRRSTTTRLPASGTRAPGTRCRI